jgi:hypothetical protein
MKYMDYIQPEATNVLVLNIEEKINKIAIKLYIIYQHKANAW